MAENHEAVAYKRAQADAWGKSASHYAQNVHGGAGIMMPLIAAYVDRSQALKMSSPQILDVAAGSGEPGISLAKLYSSGSVTITDIAEGMVVQAQSRAKAQGVANARCVHVVTLVTRNVTPRT
jgi:2-polyprenyl-3-methyl-5-hydroxy-6-metoxy-1,4-benzoquinol methylase